MHSAVTISLVPEARGGPFVFWDDLDSGVAEAARLGFDAVEVFAPSAAHVDASRLRALLDRHHIALAALGTGAGWVVRKLRLTDPDPGVRALAREFIAELIDLGASFGAPAIIGSMQGRHEGAVSREHALDWLAESVASLATRSADHGVPLLIEPLNRYETNLLTNVADGLTFLDRLNHPNVRLLCDLFHMNIEEADMAQSIRAAGPRLGHVHFVDSNRRAVGLGHTRMEPIIAALLEAGYNGYLSAEILPLPDPISSASQTLRAFRELLGRS